MKYVSSTQIGSFRRLQGLSLSLIILMLALPQAYAQQRAYVVNITGEVDRGLGFYVDRILDQAELDPEGVVLLNVQTFGGRVDVAIDIRDRLLHSPLPVIAFVDGRAISAGALITLAADRIIMTPTATIGAVTPVDQEGNRASNKIVSFMRGEMRATAEANHRDPQIAEAMVDENVTVGDSSIQLPGSIVTLTSSEAIRVGYCDTIAASAREGLIALGYGEPDIVQSQMNWTESLLGFLTSPFLSSILIMLGLAGLFYAIKTGHLGVIAAIGVTAIVLFFGGQYVADLTNVVEILMFVAGVVLLIVEIFVIPGFGITGISGVLLMVASLFLALIGSFDLVTVDSLTVPLYTLAGAFVGFGTVAYFMVRFLPNSSAFRRFVLHGESVGPTEAFMAEKERYQGLVGEVGRVITTLRPAGMVQIGEEMFDVISDGEYLPLGTPVIVQYVEGRKIVVSRLEEIEQSEEQV